MGPRLTGCATAAVVATLAQYGAFPAYAVSPPPIDHSRLPPRATAHPRQPTVQREICAVPSMTHVADTPADSQLSTLDLPQVWKLTRGSGQRVAVIDTGVAHHQRLPHMSAGGDYVFTGDGTQDCDGHGTAVAGIIAAAEDPNHTDRFTGVSPEAQVISIRQSSSKFGPQADPSTVGTGDVDSMARAVRTAADLGASVITISSVACTRAESAFDDSALGAALAYAVDSKNAVVVAAAGNTGPGQCGDSGTLIVSPAWYDDFVLTVGSIDAHGEPSSFTLGSPWVDVAAPGDGVVSLSSSGSGLANAFDGKPLSGTSFAAPVVSGLAALIRARFPQLTARQVMQRITATAHRRPGGRDPRVGAGSVDLLAAVSTDTATVEAPGPRPKPIELPPRPAPPDRRAQQTSVIGAAVCGAGLAAVLMLGALRSRSRRSAPTGGKVLHD